MPARADLGAPSRFVQLHRGAREFSGPAGARRASDPGNRAKWALAGCAALALTATANALLARRAEARNPPKGRRLTVEGVRLHYREAGSGPAVLLLHGNGATAEDIFASGLVERLAGSHRVIVFDRPGFGHSDRPRGEAWTPERQADLLFAACRELGVYRVTVAGHSWGTLVALALALRHPTFVRGLVLVSGYYFPTLRLDAALFGAPALPLVGGLLRYTLSPLLSRLIARRLIAKLFAPSAVPRRFTDAYSIEIAVRPWQIRASAEEAASMPAAALRLRPRYRHLEVPVVIFAGGEDRLVSARKHSVRLQSLLPRSELHLVPYGGHMIHYFATDKIAAAIARFGYA